MDTAALTECIRSLECELEPLNRAAAEAAWQLNVTGEDYWEEESARLDTEIRTVLSRPEPYALLEEGARGNGLDPLLHRQAVLLRNDHAPNQLSRETIERIVRLEKTLDSTFNTFRGEIDGERVSDNAIRDILERSDDLSLRRRAWEAAKQVGAEVAPTLLELVRERNAAARSLGYSNFYSMMLELDELDEDEVFALLDHVASGSEEAWERYKRTLDEGQATRFGIGLDELRPWHYSDPFFQEAPALDLDLDLDRWFAGKGVEELVTRYFDAVGFDVRAILSRSDLYEREGKCQHAFCMDVDRKGDIRVLCNLRSNEYWTATLLHELGHGVYDEGIDARLPYFLRTHAHLIVTEASAMLFGRLTRSGAWLSRWGGMSADDARAADATLGRARVAQFLHLSRWVPVMATFERALYRDPEQDLNGLWWDLVERLQSLRRPEGRDAPDWAAKIHFSVSPAYYQNYLLGEMTASQLQAHLLDEVGGWESYVQSPEVGRFLADRIYRLGRSTDWRGAIAHATGQPLDPSPFLREIAAS